MYTICFLYTYERTKASESYQIRETFFSLPIYIFHTFDCATLPTEKVFQLLL